MYQFLCVDDPVIRCPYDKAHLVSKSRIQKHIVKCEKNYPLGYKVMCPYNATHRLFKSEMTEHILRCSQKLNADAEFQEAPKNHGALTFAQYTEITSNIDCDENWDLEADAELNEVEADNLERDAAASEQALEENVDFESYEPNSGIIELRPPRGFSEAMMKEVDEESLIDDQSVVSGMAVGRGKLLSRKIEMMKIIGLGRGKTNQKQT